MMTLPTVIIFGCVYFKPVDYLLGKYVLIRQCLGDGVFYFLPLQYTRTVETLIIAANLLLLIMPRVIPL
jgi:hypothetical protein